MLALLGKDADKTECIVHERWFPLQQLPRGCKCVWAWRDSVEQFIKSRFDASTCSYPPPHNTPAVFPLAGGLQPAETSILPQHRRVLDLLLGGEPRLIPQCPGGVGARAESLHAQRPLRPHRNTGNASRGHRRELQSEWAPTPSQGWLEAELGGRVSSLTSYAKCSQTFPLEENSWDGKGNQHADVPSC